MNERNFTGNVSNQPNSKPIHKIKKQTLEQVSLSVAGAQLCLVLIMMLAAR